ncbi:glycosyltransferase [Plebeiibacterium marinum]|uniref:Uncharacterized protein n=1 Tax=Plebeiibacterium marinum TaxID=2992111 RepID=A0AAE3SIP6_9BACT|nr:glycosyltransferase [Plebeiobacterium marinum]MCW3804847.1 hypothetical protein [Plebeiobacterium marinum]
MKLIFLIPTIEPEIIPCYKQLQSGNHEIHVIYEKNNTDFNGNGHILLYNREDYRISAPLIKLVRSIKPDRIVMHGLYPVGNIHLAQYYAKLKRRTPVILAIDKHWEDKQNKIVWQNYGINVKYAIDYVWADENQCLTRNIVKKQFICDGLTSFDTPLEWAQTV